MTSSLGETIAYIALGAVLVVGFTLGMDILDDWLKTQVIDLRRGYIEGYICCLWIVLVIPVTCRRYLAWRHKSRRFHGQSNNIKEN